MSECLVVKPSFRVPELLATELTRFLERQIIFGECPPNSRLVEDDVVRRHQISRSPVREAFRALEQDGLIVRESRRGVRVSPISLVDLDEVYACRLVLEGLAAETAAERHREDHIPLLRAALDSLSDAYARRDLREYFEQNVRLSGEIYVAAGSVTLRRLLGGVGKQALRYRFLAYSRTPMMMRVSLAGSRKIVGAIIRGEADTARSLTEQLIKRSWHSVRKSLAETAPVGDAE